MPYRNTRKRAGFCGGGGEEEEGKGKKRRKYVLSPTPPPPTTKSCPLSGVSIGQFAASAPCTALALRDGIGVRGIKSSAVNRGGLRTPHPPPLPTPNPGALRRGAAARWRCCPILARSRAHRGAPPTAPFPHPRSGSARDPSRRGVMYACLSVCLSVCVCGAGGGTGRDDAAARLHPASR